jgi:hypothetical protein
VQPKAGKNPFPFKADPFVGVIKSQIIPQTNHPMIVPLAGSPLLVVAFLLNRLADRQANEYENKLTHSIIYQLKLIFSVL